MSVKTDYATNALGQQIQTYGVQHAIAGDNRLIITLENKSAADIANAVIFPGYKGKTLFDTKKYGDAAGQGIDVVFKADGFDNIVDFCAYMDNARLAIEGVSMTTSSHENYNEFIHIEKPGTGIDEKPIRQDISRRKVSLGQAFSNDMVLGSEVISWRTWYGLAIYLKKLKAGSTITFEFNIVAQDKPSMMAALSAPVVR